MSYKGKNIIKVNNCFFCHGYKFKNPLNENYPIIKNQYKDYIFYSLLKYKIDLNSLSRKNFIMISQVQNLSICDIYNIVISI